MKKEPNFDEIREQIEQEKSQSRIKKKRYMIISGIFILIALLILLKGR